VKNKNMCKIIKYTFILLLLTSCSITPTGYLKPNIYDEMEINNVNYDFVEFRFLDSVLNKNFKLSYYYRINNDSIYFLDKDYVDNKCFSESLVGVFDEEEEIIIEENICNYIKKDKNKFYTPSETFSQIMYKPNNYILMKHSISELIDFDFGENMIPQERFFYIDKKNKKIKYFKQKTNTKNALINHFNY